MTLTRLAEFLFFCSHPNTTWPRRDRVGEYQRCLDCGKRLESDFASLGAVKEEFSQSLEQFGEIR